MRYSNPAREWRPASYLEVKDAKLDSISRLAVSQEGLMVKDTSHSLVRGAGFGLGDQRRGIRVYGLV